MAAETSLIYPDYESIVDLYTEKYTIQCTI